MEAQLNSSGNLEISIWGAHFSLTVAQAQELAAILLSAIQSQIKLSPPEERGRELWAMAGDLPIGASIASCGGLEQAAQAALEFLDENADYLDYRSAANDLQAIATYLARGEH